MRVNVGIAFDEYPSGASATMQGIVVSYLGDAQTCPGDQNMFRTFGLSGVPSPGETQPFVSCGTTAPSGVAMLPSGWFCVVSREPDANALGVFARIFDQAGSPTGPEFQVNQTTAGSQYNPSVAPFADRYVVVWQDDGSWTVVGRILMPDGSMPGPEVSIAGTPVTPAERPVTAPSGTGSFLVAWNDYIAPNGPTTTVRAQVFDAAFSPMSPGIMVSQKNKPYYVGDERVAGGPAGFVVSWVIAQGADGDVFAKFFDPAGNPQTQEILVNTYTQGIQFNPYCGMDDLGAAIVVWDSGNAHDGSSYGAFAQRFDASHAKVGGEFQVNGTTYGAQDNGPVAMLPNGDFFATWSSYQDPSPSGPISTFARRYFFPPSLLVAPGRGSTNPPTLETVRPDGRPGTASFSAYGTPRYGANVGTGDVDGDGLDDLLSGPGPSPVYGPHVRAFKPDGTPVNKISFFAYGTLKYGARGAGAQLDADPFKEILTAPGEGAVFGPHVRGWNFDGGPLTAISKISFFAFQTLAWGARVVGGDVDGDGFQEILTTPGPGPQFPPQVRGWNYDGVILSAISKINFSFFSSARYGATVAAADIESDGTGAWGDGYQEIVVGLGPDPGYAADVRGFDYDGVSLLSKFEIFPYSLRYGASVAGGDIDAGDTEEVVTAPGPDPTAPAHVLCWEWDPVIGVNPDGARLQLLGPDDFTAFPGYGYGANVAVGKFE